MAALAGQGRKGDQQMRKHIVLGSFLLFMALSLVWTQRPTSAGNGGDDQSRIQKGFAIAPVPLDLEGKNPALVGLGSYIVNAQGGCNDCHTHPAYAQGGNPFQGQPTQINALQYLAGGRQFVLPPPVGTVTSRNLTPNSVSGLPANLTLDEFRNVLGTGIDPLPPHDLLQVMPWPVYGNMVDRDISAIYEYLRSIPSLPDNPNPGP
jgi:hypothetical protein